MSRSAQRSFEFEPDHRGRRHGQLGGGSGGGDDRPVESLSLNFAKYEYKYTGQESTGAAGTSPEFKFDVAGNSEY